MSDAQSFGSEDFVKAMTHFALWCVGLARPESQTNEAERNCLARHATGKRRLVEIGVFHGVTTCRLRRVMAPGGLIICVDPYPVGRLGFSAARIIARRELSKVRNGSVKWIRASGGEAAEIYAREDGRPVEFLFIDGDHTYEALRSDWNGWSPLVEQGGIVCLHDSRSSATRNIEDAGSVIFTREVILRAPAFEAIETVDTLTVLRCKEAAGASVPARGLG